MTLILAATIVCLTACCKKINETPANNIDQSCVEKTVKSLCDKYADTDGIKDRIQRGVEQAAAFWTDADGTPAEFEALCTENFVADPDERARMAAQLERNFESLMGCFNKMNVDLNLPIHVDGPEPTPLDELFGAYSPSAHFVDDMFEQKIAFIVVLNFPFYTLEEKNTLGADWSRQQWAYARLGDLFTARVPAECQQALSAQLSAADNYISNYNIQMGHLLNDQGEHLFPDLSLITHWGLRDELKTHYNEGEEGLAKQRMIYQVMRRIIDQSIPECVINNPDYEWNPFANTVTKDGKEVDVKPEPDTRYQYFLGNFHAMQQLDRFNPRYPTAIARAFDEDMEVSFDEIEQLFDAFCSAPQVGEVAQLIEQRMGRKLEPFDIWYDGFKSRSTLNEDDLSAQTRQLYPDREAFATKGMPSILNQLGFSKEKIDFICSHITVDPSRGAGHAWESNMRSDNARLRTRIGKDGMDYKGYNIAVHEFGHNVEQTITLHDVDHYIMKGVPNTAFTEARLRVPGARPRLPRLQERRPHPRSHGDARHLLGLLRDHGRGPRGYVQLALALRTSRRHGGTAEGAGYPHRPGGLEQILCAIPRRARLAHPGHLQPHDRLSALPGQLPLWSHHRVPVGATAERQVGGRRDRTHLPCWPSDATTLDAPRRRQRSVNAAATRCCCRRVTDGSALILGPLIVHHRSS